MKNKVMQLVKKICRMESTDCRSLNKGDLAGQLKWMGDLANILQTADIHEIPLDTDGQVVVLFLIPNDKNYYSFFAGIGTDGNFYFELSITGHFLNDNSFEFFEDPILSIDYFFESRNNERIDY